MTTNLSGPPSAPSAARLAIAALLLLPLLAACGADAGGGSGGGDGGGNGAEIPAPTSAAPAADPAFCGLKPEGQDQRTENGMTFPATVEFIGKSLDDARALAVSRDLQLRVVGEDGTCNAVTDDLSTGRVNVYLENGTVVATGAF